jgi:hypothetical protein
MARNGAGDVDAYAGLRTRAHWKPEHAALLREALLRALDARHEELKQALRGVDIEILCRAYLSA